MRDPTVDMEMAVSAIQSLNPVQLVAIAEMCADALLSGHKLLFCGNGGSASQAEHLAAELVGRFERERRGLAAIALTADIAGLTAISNDYGFDRVYERQVEALGTPGDVLFCLSTSGRSPNVVRAARFARDIGIKIVSFVGKDPAFLAGGDIVVTVDSDKTSHVQEAHLAAGHIVCGMVEQLVNQ